MKLLDSKAEAAWILIILSPWRRGQGIHLTVDVTLHYYPVLASRELSSDKYRHRKPDDLLFLTHHTQFILSYALFVINTIISCRCKNSLLDGRSLQMEKEERKVFSRIYEAHYGKLDLIWRNIITLSNKKNNGMPCKLQLCVILQTFFLFQPNRRSFVWCESIRYIPVILLLSTFEFFVIFFHILCQYFATCQKLRDQN
jgi:hypothetical protein